MRPSPSAKWVAGTLRFAMPAADGGTAPTLEYSGGSPRPCIQHWKGCAVLLECTSSSHEQILELSYEAATRTLKGTVDGFCGCSWPPTKPDGGGWDWSDAPCRAAATKR